MTLRIGLDARFALGERRGIGKYSLELFKAMAERNREFEFIFYSDREDSHHLLSRLPNSHVRVLKPGFYPLWEQLLLPLALRRDGIDLFHSLGNTAPIWLPQGKQLVITIHDVMYLKGFDKLPASQNWYQIAGRFYRKFIVPLASRKAGRILTISEFSLADIHDSLPSIRRDRIYVTLEGLPAGFEPAPGSRDQPPLLHPYLLHLGGTDPRKNTNMIVRSILELKRKGLIEEHLVILGLKSLANLGLTDKEGEETKPWLHLPGFVDESELANHYRFAAAFLFPSLYEGFGIPLLEAMACGTPIITSNVSSMPEIARDAALLVDPSKPQDFQNALLKLLHSPSLQNGLREAGHARLKDFSWGSTAEITLTAYKGLLAESHDKNSS